MIITAKSPSRISLFGGGTDVNPFAEIYGGMTINIAINLYSQVILCTEKDMGPIDIYPKKVDLHLFHSILHNHGYEKKNIRIESTFDGIIGAGLGSSASASVALLGAITRLKKGVWGMDRKELAEKAWKSEEDLGWHGGKQDQYASVFGGLNTFIFNHDVMHIELPYEWGEELSKYLLLFNTGGQRKSHIIQQGFQDPTLQQIAILQELKRIAQQAFDAFIEQDYTRLGVLLDTTWHLKARSNKGISNNRIDELYAIGLQAGAIGGKLLGAGGCGYIVFFCPPTRQDKLIKKLGEYKCEHIEYKPDYGGLTITQ